MSAYRIDVPEEKLITLKIKLAQAEFPDEVIAVHLPVNTVDFADTYI
jgi:hypothetical protein